MSEHPQPSYHLPPGTLLNKNQYKILRSIGQGGFGITYVAEELGYFKVTGFGEDFVAYSPDKIQKVVVKELFYKEYCKRDDSGVRILVSETEQKGDFLRMVKKQLEEGKILKQLHHPNIIKTQDIFEENGTAYMVVDYVESDDLRKILSGEVSDNLTLNQCKQFLKEIIEAVKYIHEQPLPIAHLDIDPSNIILEKTRENNHTNYKKAILIDFGAAYLYKENGDLMYSTSRQITGAKYIYAPFEQLDHSSLKKFDASFDTYAIGSTFFHVFSKVKPEPSNTYLSNYNEFKYPSHLNPKFGITEFLDGFIRKAMNPRYDKRFREAKKMKYCLENEDSFEVSLKKVYGLCNEEEYTKAKELLEVLQDDFFPTAILEKLLKKCNAEIDWNEKKNTFSYHCKNGEAFFTQAKYEEALYEFQLAYKIKTDDSKLNEAIRNCKEKLEQSKTEYKVEKLVKEAEDAITKNLFDIAHAKVNNLKELGAETRLLERLEQKIREAETIYYENEKKAIELLTQAKGFYKEEQYREAALLFEQIPQAFAQLKQADKIKLLTPANIDDYEKLEAKINTLAQKLDETIPSNQPEALTQLLKKAKRENEEVGKALLTLKLPAELLKLKLARNIQSVKAKQIKPEKPPKSFFAYYLVAGAVIIAGAITWNKQSTNTKIKAVDLLRLKDDSLKVLINKFIAEKNYILAIDNAKLLSNKSEASNKVDSLKKEGFNYAQSIYISWLSSGNVAECNDTIINLNASINNATDSTWPELENFRALLKKNCPNLDGKAPK
jgi:serine/threonine protein kinase